MKIKKAFIVLIVTIIMCSYGGVANASEILIKSSDESSSIVNEREVEEKVFAKGNRHYIDNSYNSKDIQIESSIEYNKGNGKILAKGILEDSYGNSVNKSYFVEFLQIEDENKFVAQFEDTETGEKIIYDSNELKASALPLVAGVVVAFIAKQGLKKAITYFGKKAMVTMIRSSPQVAASAAKSLGYSATKFTSHGKKIFVKNKKGGPKYISPDKDGHNGGVWKGASSVKNLGSKKTRSGTYDSNLKRIGD